jgi:hypothetical protein
MKKDLSILGYTFWIAGCLFSAGIGALDPLLTSSVTLLDKVIATVALMIFWPFLLGQYLRP